MYPSDFFQVSPLSDGFFPPFICRASLVVQTVKNLPAVQETQV